MNLQRLDKIISSQTGISRKEARADIRRGLVSADGNTVKDCSAQFNAEKVQITYKGQALNYKKFIYIIMNKPKGVLSASNDRTRKTVVDLVPDELKRKALFPAGRLDRDTTGLLIITDDGDFAHRIISPKKHIYKTYMAELDGEVTCEIKETFSSGVVLADGTVCRPAELTVYDGNWAAIRICEGKYHQIKRMFGTVGLGANSLKRTAVGKLRLPEDLQPGQSRELTDRELKLIFEN